MASSRRLYFGHGRREEQRSGCKKSPSYRDGGLFLVCGALGAEFFTRGDQLSVRMPSRARFTLRTLTRSSPNTPRKRPVV